MLKIETEPRDDHQVKLIVEVPGEDLEIAKKKAARKLADRAKIPGFRPGKAPYEVIRRHLGDEYIEQEALEILVDDVYPAALEQAKIETGGAGTMEDLISKDPPKFAFVVPLAPVVDLKDYRSIRMPYKPDPLEKGEVEKFISDLRKAYATLEPASRPAEVGDKVFMQISGKLLNPDEGESDKLIEEMPHQATVEAEGGDTESSEWPFPGFSRHLLGLNGGESQVVHYPFPSDSPYEKLRGKEAEFEVKVTEVKAVVLPELDDEFAQTVGEYKTLEELNKSVEERLTRYHQDEYDEKFYDDMLEKIIAQASIAYPPQMLEDEIEHSLEHIKEDLAKQHLDLETYLKTRQMDQQAFIDSDVKDVAKQRLERSLVIDQIAESEKLEIAQDEFKQEFTNTMAGLEYMGEFKKMRKSLSKEKIYNAVATQTINSIMSKNVLNRLKQIATGELEGKDGGEETTKEKRVSKTKAAKAEDGAVKASPKVSKPKKADSSEEPDAKPAKTKKEK